MWAGCSLASQGTRSRRGLPGLAGQGITGQGLSHCPSQRAGRAGGQAGAAPALGNGHLPGDGLRPGWAISPKVGARIRSGEGNQGQTQPEDGDRVRLRPGQESVRGSECGSTGFMASHIYGCDAAGAINSSDEILVEPQLQMK